MAWRWRYTENGNTIETPSEAKVKFVVWCEVYDIVVENVPSTIIFNKGVLPVAPFDLPANIGFKYIDNASAAETKSCIS